MNQPKGVRRCPLSGDGGKNDKEPRPLSSKEKEFKIMCMICRRVNSGFFQRRNAGIEMEDQKICRKIYGK